MRVSVRVKPGSKKPGISNAGDELIVAVREPAVEQRATAAARLVLAAYYGVPVSRVRLVNGATSRRKLFEVDES